MFKKNIRCLSAFVLAVLMLFSFAACGAKEADENRNQDANVDLNGDGDGVVRYSGEITFGYENGGYPTVVSPGSVGIKEEEEVEDEEKPQLTDGIALDVFPIIEQFIVYSGGNGGGQIDIKIPDDYAQELNGCYFKSREYWDKNFYIVYNNEIIAEYECEIYKVTDGSDSNYYSGGDLFRIIIDIPFYSYSPNHGNRADFISGSIYDSGFYFSQAEKYYTAPDFGEYITSYSQLSESEIEAIKEQVVSEELNDYYAVEFAGCYEGTVKPYAVAEPDSKFVLLTTYYTTHKGKYSTTLSYAYRSVGLYDIVRKPDGTLVYSITTDYPLGAYGKTLEEYEADVYENNTYDFVKIA